MKIPVHIAAGVAAAAILTQAPVWAEGMTLEQVVEAAKPIIDLRLRSETVRQTGIAQDARAVTLRGRLGFETGKLWDTQLLAEAELVWPLSADYNSTINGKTQIRSWRTRRTTRSIACSSPIRRFPGPPWYWAGSA